MNKSTNWGLYTGILLVLIGIIFFLDLNGILPEQSLSEYLNLIIGIVLLIAYIRQKRLSTLMFATFFIANGLLLLLDSYIPEFIYFSGMLLIPGIMFLVAFIVRKHIGYLVPGAMLSSWGVYIILLITDVIYGFTMTIGMGFVFTAIGFLVIFIFESQPWVGLPSLILGIIGIVIVTLGLGEAARHILFNLTSIGVVVIGLALILKSLFKNNQQGED